MWVVREASEGYWLRLVYIHLVGKVWLFGVSGCARSEVVPDLSVERGAFLWSERVTFCRGEVAQWVSKLFTAVTAADGARESPKDCGSDLSLHSVWTQQCFMGLSNWSIAKPGVVWSCCAGGCAETCFARYNLHPPADNLVCARRVF